MVNKERLTKAVEALESGQYRQTQGTLARVLVAGDDETRQEAYCCLGVFCEVALADGLELDISYDGNRKVYHGSASVLPLRVAKYYGLSDNPPLNYGGLEAFESGELDTFLSKEYDSEHGSLIKAKQGYRKLLIDCPHHVLSAATLNDVAEWNFIKIAKAFRRTFLNDQTPNLETETETETETGNNNGTG
jgi:hypothetical protein